MGPGEVLPPGISPSAASGAASAALFSPHMVSIYTVLSTALTFEGIAVCHVTWRSPPLRPGALHDKILKSKTLKDGVSEIACAVKYMRRTHETDALAPTLPLVLVGHCYGGAAALAAAAISQRTPPSDRLALGPLAGVVALALAPRHGVNGRTSGLSAAGRLCEAGDTLSCMQQLTDASVPLLLLHGTSDSVIGLAEVALLFDAAVGPKAAGWLIGAEHDLHSRADAVVATTAKWALGLLRRYAVSSGMLTQLPPPREADEGIPFGQALSF